MLFATLDPTSRRLRFPRDMEVIITDTVGFIRNLPAELLKALESTLEELSEADLLLHVFDISNPAWKEQVEVVDSLLHKLELAGIPCLRVYNKIDLVTADAPAGARDGICISATDKGSLGELLETIQAKLAWAKSGFTPADKSPVPYH